MKKGVDIKKVSRKELADPKLGLTYKDRIRQSKVEVKSCEFKIKEFGNGYATIMRLE